MRSRQVSYDRRLRQNLRRLPGLQEFTVPRFFVDFQDGTMFHRDDEGSDLPGFQQARNEAVAMLCLVAKERPPGGEHRQFVATLRDETDTLIYRATLTFHGERISEH